MTTLRQAHKKSYVMITNALAQDNSLSLRARGLMLYLLSLPDDWEIHLNQLESVLLEGRKSINAVIQELKKAKYLRLHKMGFKDKWRYFVFESPIEEDAFKEFLRTIPLLEEFALANNSPKVQLLSTYLNTKEPKEEKKEIYKEKEPAPDPNDRKVGFGTFVVLKVGDYNKLCEDHGKPALDEMIARINDYLASTGIKPYKDYAATIRNWFRREKKAPRCSNDSKDSKAKNIKVAWEAKKYLENQNLGDSLIITSWAVEVKSTGDSIAFDLPTETFKQILTKATNSIALAASHE